MIKTDERSDQNEENVEREDLSEIKCPFCSHSHRVGGDTLKSRSEPPFLVHNRQLDNLLEHEIKQEFDQKTEQQKEQL